MTHHLLSSLRRHALAAEHARNVDLSIGDSVDDQSSEVDRENPTMGNERHARGVPIIGRGISGAIPGTDPGTTSFPRERGHRDGYADRLGRIP